MKDEKLFETNIRALKLNYIDTLIIRDMENKDLFNPSRDLLFSHAIIENGYSVETIAKIAFHHCLFLKQCRRTQQLQPLWNQLWVCCGLYASGFKYLFQHYDSDHPFDRLMSAYFYLLSQSSGNKISFLVAAIRLYPCNIHAVQKYNQYLYEQGLELKEEKAIVLNFKTIAINCLGLHNIYPTFTYLMLTEVYYRKAIRLLNMNYEEAKKSYETAMSFCHRALTKYRSGSDGRAIANASFGKGLAMSNSFSIDHPKNGLICLDRLYPNLFSVSKKMPAEKKEASPGDGYFR